MRYYVCSVINFSLLFFNLGINNPDGFLKKVKFLSRGEDGAEPFDPPLPKPVLNANLMAVCFIEP